MKDGNNPKLWKKKSIFFELKYWKHLYMHHLLDVMHIEKNECENIYNILLNIPNKTKDETNPKLYLVHMGIRIELASDAKGYKCTFLPPACYILNKQEKKVYCQTLMDRKASYVYCSSFRNLV